VRPSWTFGGQGEEDAYSSRGVLCVPENIVHQGNECTDRGGRGVIMHLLRAVPDAVRSRSTRFGGVAGFSGAAEFSGAGVR